MVGWQDEELGHTPSSSLHLVDKDMNFQSMLSSILLIEKKLGRVVEHHVGMGSYKHDVGGRLFGFSQ